MRHFAALVATLTVAMITLGCTSMPALALLPHGLPAEMLAALRADAARQGGIAEAEVRLASVQPVTWPDASIGCPQPGMLYAQMLVPGWRVTLQAGERRYDYHAARSGRWLHCPPGRAQPPLATAD